MGLKPTTCPQLPRASTLIPWEAKQIQRRSTLTPIGRSRGRLATQPPQSAADPATAVADASAAGFDLERW